VDRERRRRFEEYRKHEIGPVENTLLDEFAAGEMDRAEFIKRASIFGLSAAATAAALDAFGHAPAAWGAREKVKAGGRLRVGIIPPPVGKLDPWTYLDQGGLETGSIAGEFLVRATRSLKLVPEIATSWKSNANATVWTYKLRAGVKFQNGQAVTADDVVATFNRLIDPNSGSQALSAFKGVLSSGGIVKVDNQTVAFHLDAPNASFPYLTSSTTYQAIILPANTQPGDFQKGGNATGAFKLTSYTPGVGAKYDRFTGWWAGHAPLDGVDVTYYTSAAAVDAALLGGQIDLIGQIQLATDRPLFDNKNVQLFTAKGSTHREICMRVDANNAFKHWQVRQAVALTLDRPAIVKTLFRGLADLGNDNPWAPAFPSTYPVPQRHKDLRTARQLMAAAGYHKGFSIQLTTEQTGEIPQLAQILQRSVKAIGINMSLQILTSTAYFAGTQSGPPKGWGNTPWLNAPINITDWGGRAVPNVFLTSAFETKGIWNAPHYTNKKFDRAATSYIASIALKDQRKYARIGELILLHDTPTIIPYFYYYIAAGSKKVKGYQASAQGTVYFSHTSLA
jgi:peptide/nickel transport system substrate-binding protein